MVMQLSAWPRGRLPEEGLRPEVAAIIASMKYITQSKLQAALEAANLGHVRLIYSPTDMAWREEF
jgi:hypothetical protein